jgi:hypothetical protein
VEAVAVRTHLASGCRDCLARVFAYPLGRAAVSHASPTPVARAAAALGRHRYTVLVLGLVVAVAALAAWPVVDVERLREREHEVAMLTARYERLEHRREELSGRIAALDRELALAEKKASRQARLTRSTAKRSDDVRRQLEAAQTRLGALAAVSPAAAATPRADVRAVVDPIPPARAGGGGGVAGRPSACAGLSAAPFGVCTTFCERLDCDVHASGGCERLRTPFARLTGRSVFPCESVSVAEDVTPCDQHRLDVWTFTARAGQEFTATADTVEGATSADLCLLGTCEPGQTFLGDDELACSFPRAGFGCPRATFVATGDGVCTVAVTVCSAACANAATAPYRLTIEGVQSITLAGDDVS